MAIDCRNESLSDCLKGRYEIGAEVGRGGSSVVYLARDLRHGRDVALKVLNPALTYRVGVERFRREIEITARLQHPHILPLIDSGEAADTVFFIMPFVEGGSLRDRIGHGPLPLGDALQIGREVASALAYASRRHVVHLDIKPENILLSDGHAIVADFGIARASCDGCPLQADEDFPVVGTPAYMSPEQAEGGILDAASDVYSFACVLFEALTGTPPFGGVTTHQILAQHWTAEPPRIRRLRPDVSRDLERVLARALAKTPRARPPIGELLDVLRAPTGRGQAPVWRPARQANLFPAVFD